MVNIVAINSKKSSTDLENLNANKIAAVISSLADIEYNTIGWSKEDKEFYSDGYINADVYNIL